MYMFAYIHTWSDRRHENRRLLCLYWQYNNICIYIYVCICVYVPIRFDRYSDKWQLLCLCWQVLYMIYICLCTHMYMRFLYMCVYDLIDIQTTATMLMLADSVCMTFICLYLHAYIYVCTYVHICKMYIYAIYAYMFWLKPWKLAATSLMLAGSACIIYMYMCLHAYIYIYIHVYMFAYMQISSNRRPEKRRLLCLCLQVLYRTYTYIYTYLHFCTYTCMHDLIDNHMNDG